MMEPKHIPPKYVVLLDTNALRGAYWLNGTVRPFVSEFTDDARVAVTIGAPEMVRKEWLNNFCTVASETISRHNSHKSKLTEMLGGEFIKIDADSDKIRRIGEEHLKNLGVDVLSFNPTTFPIEDLVERAINNQPPFNEDSDKGFKDAVIAHSLLDCIMNAERDINVVIVTADKLLISYLKEKLQDKQNVAFYQSLKQFSSDLKLKLDELNVKLAVEATNKFFLLEKDDTLYYMNDIESKAAKEYDKLFPTPTVAEDHIVNGTPPEALRPMSDPPQVPQGYRWVRGAQDVLPTQTVFVKKEKKKLIWENTIIVYQEYELQTENDNSQAGIVGSPGSVNHMLELKVTWSTTMTGRSPLTRPSIIDGPVLVGDSAKFNPSMNAPVGYSRLAEVLQSIETSASGLATLYQPNKQLQKAILATQEYAQRAYSDAMFKSLDRLLNPLRKPGGEEQKGVNKDRPIDKGDDTQ